MAGNRNSGRRPKPTALHVLRGNPSKKKLNEAEPKPPEGEVKAPESISGSALLVWHEIAPVCESMGLLTTADVWSFKTLCELEAALRLASKWKDGDDPKPEQARIESELATKIRPYYEKFGLEPAGRARISVPKREEPVSKWAGMLG